MATKTKQPTIASLQAEIIALMDDNKKLSVANERLGLDHTDLNCMISTERDEMLTLKKNLTNHKQAIKHLRYALQESTGAASSLISAFYYIGECE